MSSSQPMAERSIKAGLQQSQFSIHAATHIWYLTSCEKAWDITKQSCSLRMQQCRGSLYEIHAMRAVAVAGHICAADGAVHLHTADSGDGAQRGGGGAGVGAGKACTALVRVLCEAGSRN